MLRHAHENGHPSLAHLFEHLTFWIPAFAGITVAKAVLSQMSTDAA